MNVKKRKWEKKVELERAKLVQSREIAEDKMDQNEDLAELRAETSLTKQIMSNSMRNRGGK
jgi:hypothetical protein